jgi:hypothetical protein
MVQVVKPELAPDGRVELQLLIEDTQMRTPSGAAEIGTDEKGLGVPAAEFVSFNLQCRLRLRPGQIVLEESNQVRSKTGQARKILLVGASAD